MRFIPPAYTSFIFFLTIVLFHFIGAHAFGDPDVAWHIAAGDLIRETKSIPFHDSWSYTATDERWYNISWLFDACISFVFEKTGVSGVYAITLLVFSSAITIMANYTVKKGADLLAVLPLIIPVLLVVFFGTIARPHMFSVIFTIIFYISLHKYRENGKICSLWILPIIMALWVNIHGGFLLAFPIIAVFAGEALLNKNRKAVREYSLIVALCMLASLLNPYNFAVYYGAYRTFAGEFNTYINEWKPVEIGHNFPMTLLLGIILCLSNFSDKRIALVDRVILVALLIMSLTTVRHAPIMALLAMPCLAIRITHLVADSRYSEKFSAKNSEITTDMLKPDVKILAIIMAVGAFIFIALPNPRDSLLEEPIGFSKKDFPSKEAEFIATHYPNLRFFNHYDIGGFLVYIWRGKIKVFVDGRATSLYSEELLEDFREFANARGVGGRAEMIMAKYKFDGVIIPNARKEDDYWLWNPMWKLVYRGDAASVYIRKGL